MNTTPDPLAQLEAQTRLVLEATTTEDGQQLFNDAYECYVCHIEDDDTIAPSLTLLPHHATTQRPQLSLAAYIYESITQPAAYIVEGYTSSMPTNYADRLSDAELGAIIAYLLETYDAP